MLNIDLVLRIPSLAIHLDRQETFAFNKETQLFPLAGLVAAELNRQGKGDDIARVATTNGDSSSIHFSPLKAPEERHHPHILELIANEAKVTPTDIVDFETVLYDTQESCVGGLNEELLFSPRLDNLEMSFCSTMGLINSIKSSSSLDDEKSIRLISLFDHEEIGSNTAQGADSNFLPTIIRRLSVLPGFVGKVEADADAYEQSLSKSFLISADMAHSVNPNYAANYETDHKPQMSKISYSDLTLSPETCLGSFCSSDVSRGSLVFLKREILTPKSFRSRHCDQNQCQCPLCY